MMSSLIAIPKRKWGWKCDEHYPIGSPDSVSALKFRMEQSGLTQKGLVPLVGSRSKISEVLSGKRDLSLRMIRALHSHLGIPANVFISNARPYDLGSISGTGDGPERRV